MEHNSGSVKHTGNSIGCMDKYDDEEIYIDLSKVPSEIDIIVFTATIYEASVRKQNFGQVTSAYFRFFRISAKFDREGKEVLRFDLGEEFTTETGIVVCKICRSDNGWKFDAVGTGYQSDLEDFCKRFDVNV